MAITWNYSATDKHNAVKAGLMNSVPLPIRSALNELMQPFGVSKTHALACSGTINTDGTGNLTVTLTVS